MAQVHSTDNYTVPGGIKLFFNDGTGERDLGNMVDCSITRSSEELEHFTNRPGLRRKDKVIALSEEVSIDFSLDEPVLANMILFFKGDASDTVGAGTTAVVDDEVLLEAGYLFSSVGKPGLTSVSARQFLDYVYLDTLGTGVTFVDNSVEADTAAGTPFAIMSVAASDLYLGKLTKFKSCRVDVNTPMTGYTSVTWKYWNGSAWTTLAPSGTADFSADATVTWTMPTDWVETTVNGVTAFWVKVEQTAATPAVAATLDSIGRLALTENTDYTVDPGVATGLSGRVDGKIRAISTGKIADAEEIKVSYTYVTFSSQISNIAMSSQITGSARLEVHPQTGRGLSYDIEIPNCQINNNGNMSLDDKQFQTIPLTLVVLDDTDNTPTYPYGRIIVYDAQA